MNQKQIENKNMYGIYEREMPQTADKSKEWLTWEWLRKVI